MNSDFSAADVAFMMAQQRQNEDRRRGYQQERGQVVGYYMNPADYETVGIWKNAANLLPVVQAENAHLRTRVEMLQAEVEQLRDKLNATRDITDVSGCDD